MTYYIATHRHRHGSGSYLFDVPEGCDFGEDDFIRWLGSDFEDDRDDQFVQVHEARPIRLSAEVLTQTMQPACAILAAP